MTTLPPKFHSAKTLAHFDLSEAAIKQIIEAAHLERVRLDDFFPTNARGLTFYFHFVAGLRRYLVSNAKGWVKCTDHGLEFVFNEEKNVRVGYLSCDAATGTNDPNVEPKSTRKRGRAGVYAVEQNMQQVSMPEEFLTGRPHQHDDAPETWMLAVHRSGDAYQVELGLPITIENGLIVGWADRILVGELPLDSEPRIDIILPPPPPDNGPPRARRRRPAPESEAKKNTSGSK